MTKTARPKAPKPEPVPVLLLDPSIEGALDLVTRQVFTAGSAGRVDPHRAAEWCADGSAIPLRGLPNLPDALPAPEPEEELATYVRRVALKDHAVRALEATARPLGVDTWNGSLIFPAGITPDRAQRIHERLACAPQMLWDDTGSINEALRWLPSIAPNTSAEFSMAMATEPEHFVGWEPEERRRPQACLRRRVLLPLLRYRDALLGAIFDRLRSGKLVVIADELASGELPQRKLIPPKRWDDIAYRLMRNELVAHDERLPWYRMLTITSPHEIPMEVRAGQSKTLPPDNDQELDYNSVVGKDRSAKLFIVLRCVRRSSDLNWLKADMIKVLNFTALSDERFKTIVEKAKALYPQLFPPKGRPGLKNFECPPELDHLRPKVEEAVGLTRSK